MPQESFDVIFAVIAPREVTFFANIADQLKAEFGLSSAFVTLYGPGARQLTAQGRRVFNPHDHINPKPQPASGDEIARIEQKYKLFSLRQMLLHEKLTFGRFDEDALASKVVEYDRYFEQLLREHRVGTVVQELGGFIAPLSLYHNCIAQGVKHVFLEPSMYKGRLCYDIDSLNSSLGELNGNQAQIDSTVRDYLSQYASDRPVVIPSKDRHHFNSGLGKLINARNCRRLAEKLYVKYIRREREEYSHIANHVRRQTAMYLRRWVLWRLYREPNYKETYAYFPLHVPLDFQLTIRENQFLDQIALAQTIAESLPFDWKLYIKEHPASIGAYPFGRLKKLCQTSNVKLIKPTVNSFDLIRESACVVTINSKVGAEALMQGKRVVVLGRPPYVQASSAVHVSNIEDLPKYLSSWDAGSGDVDHDFFNRAYVGSSPGELYDNSDQNLRNVSIALKQYINAGGAQDPRCGEDE